MQKSKSIVLFSETSDDANCAIIINILPNGSFHWKGGVFLRNLKEERKKTKGNRKLLDYKSKYCKKWRKENPEKAYIKEIEK